MVLDSDVHKGGGVYVIFAPLSLILLRLYSQNEYPEARRNYHLLFRNYYAWYRERKANQV